jgi:hypothetical protein
MRSAIQRLSGGNYKQEHRGKQFFVLSSRPLFNAGLLAGVRAGRPCAGRHGMLGCFAGVKPSGMMALE